MDGKIKQSLLTSSIFFGINKIEDNTILWSYNPRTGGVATDENYVYALRWNSNNIDVLNKDTGELVSNITLPGRFQSYGGLIYANGLFYIVGSDLDSVTTNPLTFNAIHTFNSETGEYLSSVSTVESGRNSAFDGETFGYLRYPIPFMAIKFQRAMGMDKKVLKLL